MSRVSRFRCGSMPMSWHRAPPPSSSSAAPTARASPPLRRQSSIARSAASSSSTPTPSPAAFPASIPTARRSRPAASCCATLPTSLRVGGISPLKPHRQSNLRPVPAATDQRRLPGACRVRVGPLTGDRGAARAGTSCFGWPLRAGGNDSSTIRPKRSQLLSPVSTACRNMGSDRQLLARPTGDHCCGRHR